MQPPTNIPTTPPDWDSADAAKLREILESDVFKKAFRLTADFCPELMDGADVNRTLVRSGEVKGFHFAFTQLFSLLTEQPKQPQSSESYPDLDDESKWK